MGTALTTHSTHSGFDACLQAISGDVSSMTGDPSTRQNLRQLIQSLSRLLDT